MISWPYIKYMSASGLINGPDCSILDIGTQNLTDLTLARVRWFVNEFGGSVEAPDFAEQAIRIAYYSTQRPGERTTYLSELLELTPIRYESLDISPGHKTTIFDLNTQSIPEEWHEAFTLLLNLGTTEHVINQLNTFKVIHDATSVGGHMFHQVPASGWVDHGYFTYNPQFFYDLAEANNYKITDIWYNKAGNSQLDIPVVDLRHPAMPGFPKSGLNEDVCFDVPNFNINVVLKKIISAPFRFGIETKTSHAMIDPAILARYHKR